MPRLAILLALVVPAVLLLAGSALGASQSDLSITIHQDGDTTVEDPDGLVVEETNASDTRYGWRLNITDDYRTASVHVAGAFDVDRPRQVVPLLDGLHFVHQPDRHVTEVDQPARVYDIDAGEDGDDRTFTYHLGLPGNGTSELTLHVDTKPPTFRIQQLTGLDHVSFDLNTTTDEAALARLEVTPAAGGDTLDYPTPRPAKQQRFPVQGLDPDTRYEVKIRYEDWSGNAVWTPVFNVTTEPEPDRPVPEVTVVSPPEGANVTPGQVILEVRWSSPASPVNPAGVRVFFDKEEIEHDRLVFDERSVRFTPTQPLEPRTYSASVEVTNQAGGTGIARWSFQVEDPTPARSPLGIWALLVGLPLAALALERE